MKSAIILLIILGIYYQIHKFKKITLTNKNHTYFTLFVISYTIIMYCLRYQREFVYKTVSNMKQSENINYYGLIPVKDYQSLQVRNDVEGDIKRSLYQHQRGRCRGCSNVIAEKDLSRYSIYYIRPLEQGGTNDISNLGLRCNICHNFPLNHPMKHF